MPEAVAPFELDSFDQEPPYEEDAGVQYARSRIVKTFHGDVEATGTVEMLSAGSDDGGGAAYVALERIAGSVHGHEGSFAIVHIGTMTADDRWAKWPIVPGSGTAELRGITGEARIEIADDGSHTLYLDYELA